MTESFTREYKDLSTTESFAFVFLCDRCGREWRSDVYAFNPEGFEPPIDEKILSMVWNEQHKYAYERANIDARLVFNVCPECGCRVCGECFRDTP